MASAPAAGLSRKRPSPPASANHTPAAPAPRASSVASAAPAGSFSYTEHAISLAASLLGEDGKGQSRLMLPNRIPATRDGRLDYQPGWSVVGLDNSDVQRQRGRARAGGRVGGADAQGVVSRPGRGKRARQADVAQNGVYQYKTKGWYSANE